MKKSLLLFVLLGIILLPASFIQAKQIRSIAQAQRLATSQVKNASVVETDMDYKGGKLYYEISLLKGNKKYSLTYRASDSKCTEYDWELVTKPLAWGRKNISAAKAKRLAKKVVKNARITNAYLDYDDDGSEYVITLKKGNKKYKLYYCASTGKLLEYQWDLMNVSVSKPSGYIGMTRAKAIAKSKVPSGAKFIKAEFDHDDGRAVYELELMKGFLEYDLKIDARTGTVLEFDTDTID